MKMFLILSIPFYDMCLICYVLAEVLSLNKICYAITKQVTRLKQQNHKLVAKTQ